MNLILEEGKKTENKGTFLEEIEMSQNFCTLTLH